MSNFDKTLETHKKGMKEIYGEHKTADDMFEELGYKTNEENDCWIELGHKENNSIVNFWLKSRTYECDLVEIPIQLHLAIHEKLKELGWLDE